MRKKLASLITVVVFSGVLYALLKQAHIFFLVHIPWWVLLGGLVAAWIAISSTVSRTLQPRDRTPRPSSPGSASAEGPTEREVRKKLEQLRD